MDPLLDALGEAAWIGSLLVRIVVGLLFVISGGGKLFRLEKREQMRSTLQDAGIPFPRANAAFVSAVEFSGGWMLLLGLLTPLAAALLAVVMLVALATVRAKSIEAKGPIGWVGEFVYLPETVIAAALVWLMLAGPGRVSLDRLLWA